MWACLMLADPGADPVVFSSVNLVPAGDPIALLDALGQTAAGHALVVAPPALSAVLESAVTIAVGRRPELAITSLISEHSPLAILSALTLARSATTDPAIGVHLTQRLLDRSWSGAWTTSLAN